jgi:hypothetical protein
MRKPKTPAELLAIWLPKALEVGDCLEWTGKMGNGKTVPCVSTRYHKDYSAEYSVPRMLWEKKHGPIPKGMIVYRTCCNNLCVAEKHLAIGTRADWMANRTNQGLMKHTASHIVNLTKGARQRATTLNSLEKAREVRALLGEYSRKEVAALTGVSLDMVHEIARGDAWKDYSNPFAGLGA